MRQGVYSAPKYLDNYPPQTAKKWPEDIQCIIRSTDPERGSLYLSNVEAAENPTTVKKLKVGAILSCAKGYMVSHPTSLVPHYKYIPGEDKESFNISLHFDQCVEFIRQALQKTNIIVHCIAGVSRSASMVIAYFMKHRKLSYFQAFNEVKSKRKIISPNDGFIKHLKDYQLKLKTSKSTVSIANTSQSFQQPLQRTFSGQFYSPAKKTSNYNYQTTSIQRFTSSTTKNPESSYKQLDFRRKYDNMEFATKDSISISPRTKNYTSMTAYKSQSMTLIPDDFGAKNDNGSHSPRWGDNSNRYGKSMSKQLSPRRTVSGLYQKEQEEKPLYQTQKSFYPSQTQRPSSSNHQPLITRDNIYKDRKTTSNYFTAMNDQLNEKYQAIRKKYDQQIQQLSKHRNSSFTSSTRGTSYNNYTNNRDIINTSNNNSRNIYLDRKVDITRESLNTSDSMRRNDYHKNLGGRRDVFHLYDRDVGHLDLRNNPRLGNFDSLYVPRIPAGYGLGASGYYPKRYV